jgi:hypothetical protein
VGEIRAHRRIPTNIQIEIAPGIRVWHDAGRTCDVHVEIDLNAVLLALIAEDPDQGPGEIRA